MRHQLPRGWPLVSWIALIISALVSVITLRQAAVIDPLPLPRMHADFAVVPAGESTELEVPSQPLLNDPFRPGRQLPNAIASVAAKPDSVMPVSVAAIRLLGTVVRPTGSFALCQLPTDVPRIVRVGDRLGELTLILLEQGRVVFQAPRGARLELSLSQPRS